ncbi:YafY family transcriptional regulator [Dysgonomonas sp. HDW5B]|uniref:helix-turn-helix transcriptional regulator n=1 Tax=Dysgonomonas sp. HDW5B TaxID=2714927 RepID=UPI00140A6C8B|nr:YafY family protein [Dysgonomonas sp. HDW5B]QIK55467.1 YafY family transcriptional regulator [Dysgonomonas sp. HDW5B]
MNRIDRLSAILIMLQSSSSVNMKQITNRFGITPRTVYRDMKALDEAGIPIAGDSRIGFSLVEGFKLPPLMFTEKEAFAFLAAEKLVDRFSDAGFKEGYKSGIEKIKSVMRLAEIETMDNFTDNVSSLDLQFKNPSDSQNILQLLMSEISKRKKVQISYFSYNRQEVSIRKVDPIGIFFSMSHWYLVAFCNTTKDYRTFRVNRIQEIINTDEDFEREHPPLNSLLKSLKDKDHLEEVILEVSKNDLPFIDDSKYYQGLIAEKDNEDKVELHFMIFSIDRFARWYLSYIDIAKIISSNNLEIAVKEILQKSKL